MIKEWVTVVSWQNGIALVNYDVEASCKIGCFCDSRSQNMLKNLKPQICQTISVVSEVALVKGQKVEIGISKKSLLGFAMLVYFVPLMGLFTLAGLFQMFFSFKLAEMYGGALGSIGGFFLVKNLSSKIVKQETWQPIVLNVDDLSEI